MEDLNGNGTATPNKATPEAIVEVILIEQLANDGHYFTKEIVPNILKWYKTKA